MLHVRVEKHRRRRTGTAALHVGFTKGLGLGRRHLGVGVPVDFIVELVLDLLERLLEAALRKKQKGGHDVLSKMRMSPRTRTLAALQRRWAARSGESNLLLGEGRHSALQHGLNLPKRRATQ